MCIFWRCGADQGKLVDEDEMESFGLICMAKWCLTAILSGVCIIYPVAM